MMAPTMGQVLRQSRADAGLTLREVEALTGISNGYLSQLESNLVKQPSPKHLHKLAHVFRIDYANLMKAAGYAIAGDLVAAPSEPSRRSFTGLDELTDEDRAKIQAYIEDLRDARRVRSQLG